MLLLFIINVKNKNIARFNIIPNAVLIPLASPAFTPSDIHGNLTFEFENIFEVVLVETFEQTIIECL